MARDSKKCTICLIEKLYVEYSRSGSGKLSTMCKQCRREYDKKRNSEGRYIPNKPTHGFKRKWMI